FRKRTPAARESALKISHSLRASPRGSTTLGFHSMKGYGSKFDVKKCRPPFSYMVAAGGKQGAQLPGCGTGETKHHTEPGFQSAASTFAVFGKVMTGLPATTTRARMRSGSSDSTSSAKTAAGGPPKICG